MKKQMLTAVAAVLLAGLAPLAMAQNVAVVNGKAVPKARVDMLAAQVARAGRQVTPEMQEQIKQEVIAREVFMQEATLRGLDNTEDFKAQMELARQSILIRELFTDYQKNNPVSEADMKAEYDRFTAAQGGKEYHAHHILVETEPEATAIIAKLKKNPKLFEDIAKKQSKDTGSGAKGGDLEWAGPGNYVKEFSDAMVQLGKGKMTETPVKTQFGFHVIRLDETRDAQLPKFEDVKPQIAQQMQQMKLQKFQEELRGKAKVE
jgi:peptidyl-prolyl cis-trans isomerase C